MNRMWPRLAILAAMLLGLPLLGATLAGYDAARYLEFPPYTRYVQHAPFAWHAFVLYALFLMGVILPLLRRALRVMPGQASRMRPVRPFPWWGWFGLGLGAVAWILAWTRWDWFSTFQTHTFTPLWVAFILVINGLSYRRHGHCLMLDRPRFFMLLFPLSALFWWFFEYLNRFVQNWYYVGPALSANAYFWYATLPFSTVLPAVLSTRFWLVRSTWIQTAFKDFYVLAMPSPRLVAGVTLIVAGFGLAAIGVWPSYLFPLLWVSPVLVVVAMQALGRETHLFSPLAVGDWRNIVASALAALFCGVFWETWNFYSYAKWQYSIPYVHRFLLFEMPILGYGGYLPFGLECAMAGALLQDSLRRMKIQAS